MKTVKHLNRLISLLLALVLVLHGTCAMADWSGWDCPVCGQTGNTGNYCPNCAAPQPSATWTCPRCGQTGNEGNFCFNCAYPRPSSETWICPQCGKINMGHFCDYCGYPPADRETGIPYLSELYRPVWGYMPELDDSSQRRQSKAGPSREYPRAGAYKPCKVRQAEAYFVEGNYVLVHLKYQTVEDRFLYFPTYCFASLRNVPVIDSLSGISAWTPRSTTAFWGPGSQYTTFEDFGTYGGEQITVFFRENGYVYAEYTTSAGPVRMWLPESSVEYN